MRVPPGPGARGAAMSMKSAMPEPTRLYPVLFSEGYSEDGEEGELPALYWMSPVPPPVPPPVQSAPVAPALPDVPEGPAPLPRWPSGGRATRAHGLIKGPHALVVAPLLFLFSCATLEPQKRTLTVLTPGQRASVALVYPGLHVPAASELLTGEAAAVAAALHCDTAPVLTLTSAAEETAAGKDGTVTHTTTILGLGQCGGSK